MEGRKITILKNFLIFLLTSILASFLIFGGRCVSGFPGKSDWKIDEGNSIDDGPKIWNGNSNTVKNQDLQDWISHFISDLFNYSKENPHEQKEVNARFTLQKHVSDSSGERIYMEVQKLGKDDKMVNEIDSDTYEIAQKEADEKLLQGLDTMLKKNETLEDVFKSEKISGY